MLYRSLLVAACLLGSAEVAFAEDDVKLNACLRRVWLMDRREFRGLPDAEIGPLKIELKELCERKYGNEEERRRNAAAARELVESLRRDHKHGRDPF